MLVARLEALGRERALIYKTLVLTGLRKGELASLTVGQVTLADPVPHLVLDAADEKNREGSTIPLRADLAADLRAWLAEKAKTSQEAASEPATLPFDPAAAEPQRRNRRDATGSQEQACQRLTAVPGLPPDAPLFNVPAALVKILEPV